MIIIDEAEARGVEEEERIPYTGTIGLIIFAQEKGNISRERAMEIIKKLSRSDFRIYNWRDIKNPAAGGAEVLTHEIA